MTAEPVCHEIALSNHMKVTLEYDPDGSRTAILWNEANEPIADGDAPVLSAAPAVQPAAGSESLDDAARRLFAEHYPDRDYDNLKDMVKIGWLRKAHDAIPAAISTPAQTAGEAYHAEQIAEAMDEGGGFWKPCSGCQEGVDGYVSQKDYPFNPVFRCQPGGGCSECGGLGVRWDYTDYDAMAQAMFQDVEDALDRAGAPCRADGDTGRWLTLGERIAALSAPHAAPGEGEQS